MRKVIGFVVIMLVLCCLFVGCEKKAEIKDIVLNADTVKYTFDVDEEFDYERGMITAIYSDGQRENVAITPEMVFGFDTKTTGEKFFEIRYLDLKIDVNYEVRYSPNPSRDIVTSARIKLEEGEYASGVGRIVLFEGGDLNRVRAVMFTVKCDGQVFNKSLNNLVVASAWTVQSAYVDASTVKIVFYGDKKTSDGFELAKINIAAVADVRVRLTDIVVSDGTKDIYLPNTVAV